MTFESISNCSFHNGILDFHMSLTVCVCINVKNDQFFFTFEHVGDIILAHFDVVRLLKPGDYLNLGQLSVCCVIVAMINADVIRPCGVFCSLKCIVQYWRLEEPVVRHRNNTGNRSNYLISVLNNKSYPIIEVRRPHIIYLDRLLSNILIVK